MIQVVVYFREKPAGLHKWDEFWLPDGQKNVYYNRVNEMNRSIYFFI